MVTAAFSGTPQPGASPESQAPPTVAAAAPGEPFKLGRLNAVDRATALVGAAAGPLLRVDNNGGGPALALKANPGAPPLTVNAGSGKAANLDADKLDGKDSSAFLAADAKASSAGEADLAADADNLGGMAPEYFMRSEVAYREAGSGFSGQDEKTAVAACREEEVALSGGASVVAPAGASAGAPPVALVSTRPAGRGEWKATARKMEPYDGDWGLLVHVLCVDHPSGQVVADGDG